MNDQTPSAQEIEEIDRDLSRSRWRIALSSGLEREFHRRTYEKRISRIVRWQIAAIFLNLACLPLDYLGGILELGLITRLGVVTPLHLLAILVLQRGPARLHPAAIVAPLVAFAAAAIYLGFRAPPADGVKYLMATALLLSVTNIVVPMSFRQALAATAGSIAALFALLFAVGTPTPDMIGLCAFVTVVSFVLLVVRFRSEKEAREVFLFSRKDEIKSQHLLALTAALAELADTDQLTDLPNRRHLSQTLNEAWRAACESNDWIGILMVDIDNFKKFNDAVGHDEGDTCLKAVSGALRGETSQAGHYLARYGGEEFTAILSGLEPEPAMDVAERLRSAVERLALPHPGLGRDGRVTVSIGAAAVLPSPQLTVKELVSAADRALYEAKAAGRNRVACGQVIPFRRENAGRKKTG